jgi:hypothetical protein
MLPTILTLIFGLVALARVEFKVTRRRKVKGSTGHVLGVILLLGAGCQAVNPTAAPLPTSTPTPSYRRTG